MLRKETSKERNLSLLEQTLPKLQPKVMGMQTLQNLSQNGVMLFNSLSKDQNIIDVGDNPIQVCEHLMHQFLTDCTCICEAQWQMTVLVQAQRCQCGSQWAAVWVQLDIVVALDQIELREVLRSHRLQEEVLGDR